MIKVTALTSSRNDPSTRFRIRQFINPLSRLGIDVAEYYPLISKYRIEPLTLLGMLTRLPGLLASRFSDITWFGRELLSGKSTLERYAGRKRLFDVDDAIWLIYKRPFSEEIASQCHGVIAGNHFLADHYRQHCARIWVVPTSVDTERWKPAEKKENAHWTIGWTGTWSNLKYLYSLEETLADFLAQHAESRLLIVCDRRPAFEKIPAARWRFVEWSPDREVLPLQEMDVGLMPLEDSEWSRGKCAFKMLSYMAVGLPVIVSPVGVNQEILQRDAVGLAAIGPGEWYAALQSIYSDREMSAQMGRAGRRVVEEHYSVNNSALMLARIFREVAGIT